MDYNSLNLRVEHLPGPLLIGRLVALLLIGALVTLVPLAHGRPPDQTWISGLYDDADHDDAVLAVTDGIGFPVNDGPAISPVDSPNTLVALLVLARLDPPRIDPAPRAPPFS